MHGNGTSIAILVGVWATFALDVYSTLNSSPQTTEIWAGQRKDSLMFWVMLGGAVAVAGGAIATLISGHPWPLFATAAVTLGMLLLYKLAVRRGTGNAPPEGSDGSSSDAGCLTCGGTWY